MHQWKLFRDKKEAAILLDAAVLLEHIENNAFIQAEALIDKDDSIKALLKDIGQDKNLMRVKKIIKTSVKECEGLLGGFTKEPSAFLEAADNVELCETERYVIRMHTPFDFPRTVVSELLEQVDEYVVSRVLYDWCSIILLPDCVSVWADKKATAENNIKKLTTFRMKPVRRKMSPF